jgi:hypothetical protein
MPLISHEKFKFSSTKIRLSRALNLAPFHFKHFMSDFRLVHCEKVVFKPLCHSHRLLPNSYDNTLPFSKRKTLCFYRFTLQIIYGEIWEMAKNKQAVFTAPRQFVVEGQEINKPENGQVLRRGSSGFRGFSDFSIAL